MKTVYPPETIAHALTVVEASGGNVLKASRELGIPNRTVSQWVRGQRRKPVGEVARAEHDQLVRLERSKMAKLWRDLTYKVLERLDREIDDIKHHDLVVLAGIGTDKHLALTGGNRTVSDVNVTVTLADLYRRALPVIDTTLIPGARVETKAEEGVGS